MTDPAAKWDRSYADRLAQGEQPLHGQPSLILAAHEHLLPSIGSVVDVAAGLGKNAGWLGRRGLDVLALDISAVAVDAVTQTALAEDLSVRAEVRNIETDGLGDRRFDVIVITYFLDRDLLRALPAHLNPEGLALFAQPTVTNLERNDGPSARFSLEAGEVAAIAADVATAGVEIVTADEQWRANNTHEAWLVVQRRR